MDIFSIVLKKIRFTGIRILITLPILVGLGFALGSLAIEQKIFGKNVPNLYIAISGILTALIMSLSGIFQVIKQEGPGPLGGTIKGLWPVITGLLWILFTWAIAFYMLYHLFF